MFLSAIARSWKEQGIATKKSIPQVVSLVKTNRRVDEIARMKGYSKGMVTDVAIVGQQDFDYSGYSMEFMDLCLDTEELVQRHKEYGRRTIETGFELGRNLLQIKAGAKHGDYQRYLDSIGLSRTTAYHWTRKVEEFMIGETFDIEHLEAGVIETTVEVISDGEGTPYKYATNADEALEHAQNYTGHENDGEEWDENTIIESEPNLSNGNTSEVSSIQSSPSVPVPIPTQEPKRQRTGGYRGKHTDDDGNTIAVPDAYPENFGKKSWQGWSPGIRTIKDTGNAKLNWSVQGQAFQFGPHIQPEQMEDLVILGIDWLTAQGHARTDFIRKLKPSIDTFQQVMRTTK